MLAAIATSVPYVPNLVKLRNELFITDQRTLLKYLDLLEKAEVISTLMQSAKGNKMLQKPDKIYLGNTNYLYSLEMPSKEQGTIREIFFESQLRVVSQLSLPTRGDFMVNNKYIFEVGGKNKSFEQIKNLRNAFVVSDDIENGVYHIIPLWLFGFLY